MRKHSQRPGDHQHEVGVGLHVEEGAQRLDRSAGHWHRQRLHPGGAAEAHRRIVDHPPAGGIDLHRPPGLVAEVEVEPVVQPADADMDDTFGRVEMRLGLDHVERRLQCLGTRRALRRLKEAACQPAAEALGADWPGLAMAVDVEVGEAGSVRRVKQLGRLREVDQDIGLSSGRARRRHHFPRRCASSSAVTRQPALFN